jgi:hypothetical protein
MSPSLRAAPSSPSSDEGFDLSAHEERAALSLAADDAHAFLAWWDEHAEGLSGDERGAEARALWTLALGQNAAECAQALLDSGEPALMADAREPIIPFAVAFMGRYDQKTSDFLLSRFDPVDADPESGLTALHLAATCGARAFLDRVIADGRVGLESKNAMGETALALAAQCEETDCARALLGAGASAWTADQQGLCAMDHALRGGNEDLIRLLSRSDDNALAPAQNEERRARAFRKALASQLWRAADILCEALSPASIADAVREARGGWLSRLLKLSPVPLDGMPRTAERLRALEEGRQLRKAMARPSKRGQALPAGFGEENSAPASPERGSGSSANRPASPTRRL